MSAIDAAAAPAARPPGAPPEPLGPGTWRVGTLSYTTRGLVFLFAWLLIGDFCFQMMDAITPAIIPLTLQGLEAPNWIISLFLITIPGVLNMTVCPWVSYVSDRHRGPGGRRIPFILKTLPPLVLFMALLGFSTQIGAWLHGQLPASWGIASATVAVGLIGIFLIGFVSFNYVVGSVFWYLFNDVVPATLLGRFLGLFRIVGGLQSMLFNFFIFKHAATHMTAIYIGAALLYGVGMGLMCMKVKEGGYPPPPAADGVGLVAALRTYLRECFRTPVYWDFFIGNACWGIAQTILTFSVFMNKSIGLDLGQIGYVQGVSSIAGMILTYPAGALGDRFHPLRVLLWVKTLNLVFLPAGLIWLVVDFSPRSVFTVAMVIAMINVPFGVLTEAMTIPMYMRVLPRERFGQFSSANALVRALAIMAGGMLAGIFLDVMKHLCHGSDYAYRFIPLWSIFWSATALFFLRRLYVRWKAANLPSAPPSPLREQV